MDDQETCRRVWPEYELPFVSYGLSYYEACAKHVKEDLGASSVYIVVSKSLTRNGNYLQRLKTAIGEENIANVRVGLKPHSMYSEVIEVAKEIQKLKVDCLITLGGGSLIDAGKGAILADANDADTIEKLDKLFRETIPGLQGPLNDTFNGSTIPMIAISTTLSGGEYNAYGACTNDITHNKQLFGNRTHEPRLIILDPTLTFATPMRVWISTGVRAIDHCVEALCSIRSNDKANSDFVESLRLLTAGLLRCMKNPTDSEARMKCQSGCMSYMKVMALKIPLGASHGIGRQLGPYNVPHGETSCILMPAVAKYNARVNAAQQARILDILWSEDVIADVLEASCLRKEDADLCDALDAIIQELQMPRDLKSVGIGPENLGKIAENSLNDPWCQTNPVPLSVKEQVLEILGMVVGPGKRTRHSIKLRQSQSPAMNTFT